MSSVAPALVVRRTIRTSVDRVFAAWTTAELLKRWWGPQGVTCPEAEIDLRVGGQYRIANQLPGGGISWISGEFELIEAPRRLVYTWGFEPSPPDQRVTVEFAPHDGGTEITILHEGIGDVASREEHEQGWIGCLDGLIRTLEKS